MTLETLAADSSPTWLGASPIWIGLLMTAAGLYGLVLDFIRKERRHNTDRDNN